jgi:hypothetical protein
VGGSGFGANAAFTAGLDIHLCVDGRRALSRFARRSPLVPDLALAGALRVAASGVVGVVVHGHPGLSAVSRVPGDRSMGGESGVEGLGGLACLDSPPHTSVARVDGG